MLNDVAFVGKFTILLARNNYKCKNENKKYATIILLSLACRGQLNNEMFPIYASNIKKLHLKRQNANDKIYSASQFFIF